MVLEYAALGVLVLNVVLILALGTILFMKRKKPVDPMEFEMMEHEDPEKIMLMKMITGKKMDTDDITTKMLMRDMLHKPKLAEEHHPVAERYSQEHVDHESFIRDKSKIRDDIKSELKDDIKAKVKEQIRRKLESG